MPKLIREAGRGVLEILGSVERSSHNPRRNTSINLIEALQSGNKEETRFRLASALYPLCFRLDPNSLG